VPVLLFGSGGTLVEVFKDRALGLPPLTTTLARRMMEQTKIYEALKGIRGRPPVDQAALEKIMVRFSQIVTEQPWIKEMDINPLLASHERLLALDARVVLHDASITEDQLPRTAIRPYPTQYITPWESDDQTAFSIRPIRPEDEPLMVKFHETLSENTVYMRYFSQMQLQQRISHERLSRVCFIDYDREMILVGTRKSPQNGESEILGTMRISRLPGRNDAEFGMLISDSYQGHGLGKELLLRSLDYARAEKLAHIVGYILPENERMLALCKEQGFTFEKMDSGYIRASLAL